MIRSEYVVQTKFEMVSLEELVPEDHLLRAVERHIDFDRIRTHLIPYYSPDKGRPALEPIVLFKMMFLGYLYGIRSERQLMREIEVNTAYRWFLGLGLHDTVPHHSVISQNRRRRFSGTSIFRDLFEDVVLMGMEQGFIEGKELYTDSTKIRANANRRKFIKKQVRRETKDYIAELEAVVNADRTAHGKKPLPPKDEEPPSANIRESTTDPDSGYMSMEHLPRGFYYSDHRTCDGSRNFITDVYVTPSTTLDAAVYLDRLDYQRERFDFTVETVGLDAGYNNPAICRELIQRSIAGVIAGKKFGGTKGCYRPSQFTYDSANDCYICPEQQILTYQSTGRNGRRTYVSDPSVCKKCPSLSKCTHSKKQQRKISRHVWEGYREQIERNRNSDMGKVITRRRRETVERSFADAKQLHGYRFARFRGQDRVESQSLMTAMTQNLKKMVLLLEKQRFLRNISLVFGGIRHFLRGIRSILRPFNPIPQPSGAFGIVGA